MMHRCFCLLPLALLCLTPPTSGEATLETLDTFPAGLAESLQGVLGEVGYRVLDGDRVLGEFWLRKELPLEGQNVGALGIEFGQVTASALVGIAHFPEGWIDYRDTDLDPGLYTLRYWIQPADGDHMGVSEYRDFLLMNRAAEDTDPSAVYERDPLLELSREASGRVHPAVLSIFPIYDELSEAAQLMMNDLDQLTLAVSMGDSALGLVVEGHGDIQ